MKPAKGPKKPPAGSLQIVASDVAVVTGTTTTFGATGGDPPYKFAFADAGNVSGGSIDQHGHYQAGPATGTDTIEVTDRDRNKASTTVEVKPVLQVEVPDDEMHKVQLGTPKDDPSWWQTWLHLGSPPVNPSPTLEITVATGVEVSLKVEDYGGVPDFVVDQVTPSGGSAESPAAGKRAFTYRAGLTVGGDGRATDTLTISDHQSTPNQATLTITVTENFEDLATLASKGSFKLPFVAYRTWHFFAGFSFHDGIIFPPPPAVPKDKMFCIDASLLHTTGLQSLPSRGHAGKRGPVVAPGHAYLIGRGSDAGFVVPHISIPINNILLPLVILLGESKSLFGSSSVRLPCWSLLGGNDECDAACTVPLPWMPLGLNLACSDEFPLPTDLVIAPSTILVGMGLLDFVGGLIDVGLEYLVAGIMYGGSKLVGGKGAGQIAEKASEEVTEKALKEGGEELGEKGLKEGVEKAAKEDGLLKSLGRQVWAGDATKRELVGKDALKAKLDPKKLYEQLANRSTWDKTSDVLEGVLETILFEQPLGWAAGRLGKIDDTLRGLEDFDALDWWEWDEINVLFATPGAITGYAPISTLAKVISSGELPDPVGPEGQGWWGD